LFNIEELQKYMEKTVPAVTQGEYDFYEKQKLAEDYNLKNH